jgi:N-acetylglucosamine malate deacetylase 1
MTKRILAIGAHADDGVFWCGATLLKAAERGHEVHYLSITKNVGDRQIEAMRELCREYSMGFQTLGLASQDLTVDLPTKRAVAGAVSTIGPDVALVMWPHDLHHDHSMASQLGFISLRQCHRLHDQPFTIPERILYYEAGPAHSLDFKPSVYVDVTCVWDRYREFLRKAACDILKHPGIETKEILAQYRALETNRGFDHSARYAEAFTPADHYVQDIV